jgi:hypothetical protein
MDLFHYTSMEKFKEIQKSKILLPLSNPFGIYFFTAQTVEKLAPERVKSDLHHEQYLVGIPSYAYTAWKKSGLLENIIGLTTGEVLIQFSIKNQEDSFIRDAKYITAEYMKKDCGRNLWLDLAEGRMMPSQFACRKYHRRYIQSTTLLENYDGGFEVPEIWVPHGIPLDEIIIVKRIKKTA